MVAPVIAIFTGGEPQLLSIDELRDLIGITDLEARLKASSAAADDRLTAVAGMSGQALQDARADLLRTFERFDPIEAQFGPITTDISALQQANVGYDLALDQLGKNLGAAALDISALQLAGVEASDAIGALASTAADQQSAQRQVDQAAGRVGEALLRAVLESTRTRDVLRDAGIVVDPTTGIVRIYALDQLQDRTSSVELVVDSVKSTLTQKASVNFVNEQIALAVLDPTQVAQLEPILARLTAAESEIDGLNAAVRLKASIDELTALTARTRATELNVDALNGQIGLKASADEVDRLTLRTSSIEQTLSALPDTAGLVVEVRQARGTADDNADALLHALAAGETTARYQVTQIALARQELSTRMDDGFSAAALARTALSVRIDAASAMVLSEAQASVTRDAALTQRIDAQAAILGDQAATIGRIDKAAIDASGGVASAQMTIRQMLGAAGTSDEALLRALAAGEQEGQARAQQLVQIQTQFTTSLTADRQASAVAQQAILARMNAAEAAIVSTSKVLADTTGSYGSRISAVETALADPLTGQAATRVRINAVEDASATRDAALGSRIDGVEAIVNDAVTGLPATRAALTAGLQAAADRDSALAEQYQSLTAELHDPQTGLAATYANLVTTRTAQVDGDKALAERIDAQGVVLNDQAAAIGRLDQASIDAAGGIASTQLTIRQAIGDASDGGEALLRALAAGEQEGQIRAQQLAQVQSQFTTTLVAGQRSEAAAREALLARLGLAESAIVTTAKAAADATSAVTSRVAALEAAFNDAANGLAATRARLVSLEETSAAADQALAHRLDLTEAVANGAAAGVEDAKATAAQDREASASRDAATAHDVQQLSAQVNDPATGLPATLAALADERTVRAGRDDALTQEITVLSAQVNDPDSGLPATRAVVASNKQAQVDGDHALAQQLQQISTTQDGHTATINFLMRSIDGEDAVAQLTTDVDGKITGFRINGKDSLFAIAADRFVVGGTQVFEVDATTGVTTIAYLSAGVITAREISASAVQQTIYDVSSADITIAYG